MRARRVRVGLTILIRFSATCRRSAFGTRATVFIVIRYQSIIVIRYERSIEAQRQMSSLISAIAELIALGIPSGIYVAVRGRRGEGRAARRTMGLTRGTTGGYALAIAVFAIALVLSYLSVRGIAALAHGHDLPAGRTGTGGGLTVTAGPRPGPAGDVSTVLTTAAEEVFFRGFLAGLLIERLGFATGNTIQALLFLAPHALLLAVAPVLWPVLPTQLLAGWLLGWLRHRSGSIGPCCLAHAATNILAPLLVIA